MPSAHDVFTRICRRVEERYRDTLVCGPTVRRSARSCGGKAIPLDDLTRRAVRSDPGSLERTAAWEHVAHHLREEAAGGGEPEWELITVCLLAPRLRGAAYAIARRTGAERADVGSALLLGVAEAVRTVADVDAPDIERHVLDRAFVAAWRTGRRGPGETPVGDLGQWDALAARRETPPEARPAPADEMVRVDAMSAVLAQRAQGERLGSPAGTPTGDAGRQRAAPGPGLGAGAGLGTGLGGPGPG